MDVENNRLTGPFPELGSALSNNSLDGAIPKQLGKSGRLARLRLAHNSLSGTIPPELGYILGLRLLDLSYNDLAGTLPLEITNCSALLQLFLQNNCLSGTIPPGLGELFQLGRFDLSSNQLTGSIPGELGNLSKLQLLELNGNLLSGSIPVELGRLAELTILDLQDNQLEGSIPSTLGGLKALLWLRLSQNSLSGPVLEQLGQLLSLQIVLDLSYNHLSGAVPSGLGNLQVLEGLNLSNNKLTVDIPDTVAALPGLITFNMSNNNLSSSIPVQLSKRFPASAFLGNPGLCGAPLATQCRGIAPRGSEGSLSVGKVAGITIACILVSMGFLLLVVSYSRKRRSLFHRPIIEMGLLYPCKIWTLGEIMDVTDSLSDGNIIGSGGFGNVYKATMKSGEVLAVKRAFVADGESSNYFDKSFLREVETLGKVRHRHLVKLIGFYSHRDLNLLVYNYMPNGSLWDRLHGQPEKTIHAWKDRFKIAVGIAEGISYLHHDCQPKIIHRDIKSSNILLDSEGEAHVGDFGFAKLVDPSRVTASASTAL